VVFGGAAHYVLPANDDSLRISPFVCRSFNAADGQAQLHRSWQLKIADSTRSQCGAAPTLRSSFPKGTLVT